MKWELKEHSYQIADTGDYDGCYEITDGKISILTNDDGDSLQPIIDAFNNSGCDFYQTDAIQYENEILKNELAELREQVRKLREGLGRLLEQYSFDVFLDQFRKGLDTYNYCKKLLKETEG